MFIKPEEAINNFELRRGMTVADFGSGSGHYVLPAAQKVGTTGIVYAIDIQKSLLEKIKKEAENKHLGNVEIVWADLEGANGTHLATGVIDFVIASNILFQVDNREAVAKEIFRVLKSGGRVAIIDWSKSQVGLPGQVAAGPALNKLLSKQEAERIFLQEGFVEVREFPAGENHYGIIFKK